MELKKYLEIIRKNLLLITVIAAIGAVLAYFAAPHMKSGFRGQETLYLSNQTQSSLPASNYNYSGYYSQSTAIDATDTAVAILESQDFQSQFKGNKASITVRKVAPQVIEITVISPSSQQSEAQMKEISAGFNQKMQQLNPSGPSLALNPLSAETNISYYAPSSKLLAVAGAMIGIVFAFLVLGFKQYLEF